MGLRERSYGVAAVGQVNSLNVRNRPIIWMQLCKEAIAQSGVLASVSGGGTQLANVWIIDASREGQEEYAITVPGGESIGEC